MTVFVDDLYRYPAGQFGRMKMSHMIADDEAELHDMARRIGVARRWHQGDHYDICLSRRERAIELGAREITWREAGQRIVAARRQARARPPSGSDRGLNERARRPEEGD